MTLKSIESDPIEKYIGRFAPSPTGDLHFGSLVAALASFCDAKANRGKWLVRIEDIDPPREIAGASKRILETLEAHGLHWDNAILYQHTRNDAYQHAIEQLIAQQQLFACTCSRSDLSGESIYPGACRQQHTSLTQPFAWRCRVKHQTITIEDTIQGLHRWQLANQVGDFILKRKEGLFAYQLAVVIDDAAQQISHIVRGYDLLDSTPKQIYLQQLLKLPAVQYAHLPLAINSAQQKLSKQNFAPPLDEKNPIHNLCLALRFLNQPHYHPDNFSSIQDVLQTAINHWQIRAITACAQLPIPNNPS